MTRSDNLGLNCKFSFFDMIVVILQKIHKIDIFHLVAAVLQFSL